MKIVYTCYGGAHSSPVVAAIHLGKLPGNRVPTKKELIDTHYYDKVDAADHGRIFPVGTDDDGNEVYILGRGSADTIAIEAARSGWLLAEKPASEIMFVDTLPTVNWLMRIGGFLSRSVRLVALGRPIVMAGTRKSYHKMIALAQRVKADLGTQDSVSVAGDTPRQIET